MKTMTAEQPDSGAAGRRTAPVVRRLLVGAAIGLAGAGALMARQAANPQNDWPTYGHDDGSTRFSALRQITTSNASQLKLAWTYHTAAGTVPAAPAAAPQGDAPPAGGRGGGRGGGGNGFRASEASPIVVGGIMYLPTPYGRVVALHADTGQELWAYNTEGGAPTNRGVEYWPGTAQQGPRIILSIGNRLVALDAKTGTRVTTFGADGYINLRDGVENGFANGQISLSSPPKVYKNLIITGLRVQESPALGFAGDTRAWDAVTGKLVWQFHSIPRPGDAGSDTWQGDEWKNRSGANVWGFISVDTTLGLVYLPYGTATYDFYGGDRKGANLYGDSVVALEAETGKLKWHFQAVHHDTWDYDFSAAPVLFEVNRNGQRIPALAEVSKQGLVYILDRRDGKPIFGMEEKPVPASDVPGEDNSFKTQPFPVKPAPVARMSFTPADIATVTRFHNLVCALHVGTPCVSLGYAQKNQALLEEVDLGRFSQEVENFDLEILKRHTEKLIAERAAHAAAITRKVADYELQLKAQERLLTEEFLQPASVRVAAPARMDAQPLQHPVTH